jgi:hypothetical protein
MKVPAQYFNAAPNAPRMDAGFVDAKTGQYLTRDEMASATGLWEASQLPAVQKKLEMIRATNSE